MNEFRYVITGESVTAMVDGTTTTVKRGAKNFAPLRAALLAEDWTAAKRHLSVAEGLMAWAQGKFSLDPSRRSVLFEGQPIPADLNERIMGMAANGEDPSRFCRFWERLQENPSHRSVEQLFRFLGNLGIPFTEDGKFLAYKGVKEDFKDCHSGVFDNRPGNVCEMPRNRISDDPNHACHEGLHVGALEYARDFGPRVVICRVDPADVVCVPYDSSSQKMRVCRYEVVGLHGEDHLPSTSIDEEELPPRTFFLNEQHEILKRPGGKKRPKGFQKLDGMSKAELLEVSYDGLRAYASKGLLIVGASRIKGGKEALVERIMQERNR